MSKNAVKEQGFIEKNVNLILIVVFLVFCIYSKLAADFSAGHYGKIVVRFLFIGVVSLLISLRLGPLKIRQQKSFLHGLLVIIFLGVLFYPLCSQVNFLRDGVIQTKQQILPRGGKSVENILSLCKKFPEVYQKYAGKNFKLPHWYINLESLVKIYILHVSPNTAIALGKNGFYFEGWGARKVEKGITENFDNIADYMGQIPFSKQELRQWRRTLEERQYWLRERGSKYVFVLAPTKALVYPEFLPESLQRAIDSGGTTRYQQLVTYLKEETTIPFIDLLPALQQAKKERDYPLLFYKTDFHWNFYGAFIAYQSIIDHLREMFPEYDLPHPLFSEFSMSVDTHWAHHRFIDMIGLPLFLQKREHYITMIPKKGGRWDSAEDLPEKGIYDFYPPSRPITASDGTSMNIRLIRNPQAKIPSLLLLGDSFLEKCVYYFSADAREVMNYRTVVNFPGKIFYYKQPTLVIQEILNMFILRKPPENPPGFAASYLRQKFAESSDAGQKPALLQQEDGGWICHLPESQPAEGIDFRIAHLSIEASSGMELTVLFGNSPDSTQRRQITAGKNELYFEIPPGKITTMTFTSSSAEKGGVTPLQLEIRNVMQ